MVAPTRQVLRSGLLLTAWISLLAGGCQPGGGVTEPPPTPSLVHGPGECVECHAAQARDYSQTGHARTLARAGGAEFLERFAAQTVRLAAEQERHEIQLVHRDDQVHVASEQFPEGLPIEWVFGSGRHAQTPVTTHVNPHSRETESIQFFTSWYPEHGIDWTPGIQRNWANESLLSLGVPTDVTGTVRCFHCHISEMTIEGGELRTDQIVAGVQCSRCHDRLESHVKNQEITPRRWSRMSPEESVHACAECHRTDESLLVAMAADAPVTTARFAPVGILKSQCFLRQSPDRRFDCTTCHDPHTPLVEDASYYDARCAECHSTSELPGACHESSTGTSCVACHMPRVPGEGPLEFTEHWIRRPQR